MNCANHPDREKVVFCQDCGKPLCQECTRTVGSAVYCEESLAARLGNAGAASNYGSGQPRGTFTSTPTGGSYTYTGSAGGIDYTVTGAVPPQPPPGAPSPGLAVLLGIIPGVGAMYNGQYVKGIVHLVIFAILVSLSDEHGIFGLLTAGWIIYQVIEAHHTARARRDGTPLPNPFGLNDLGERLGFSKSWSNTPPQMNSTPTPTPASYAPPQATPNWENVPPPPVPPYGIPAAYPVDPITHNRFPTGALWLIGMGVFFLVGNSGLFHHLPLHHIFPFLVIGFGIWLFVRRMTDTGLSISDDGSTAYQYRLYTALQGGPSWIILIGVLFLLDSFRILSWGRSWPLFIILAGLMAIFRRTVNIPPPAYPYPPMAAAPQPTPGTSIIPSNHHDEEGK